MELQGRKLLILISLLFPITTWSLSQGYYVGLQLGRANTNIPRIPLSTVTQDILTAANKAPGAVVTIGGVSGIVNSVTVDSLVLGGYNPTLKDRIAGGRFFVGYQLFDQLAFELGYLNLRDQTSSYSANPVVVTTQAININGAILPASATFNSITRTDTWSENAIDLTLKAIVPFCNNFNTYAKLGIAYMGIKRDSKVTLNSASNVIIPTLPPLTGGSIIFTTSTSSNGSKLYPLIGLGASYGFNNDLDIDASWTRYLVRNQGMKDIDMVFIGLIYHFGGFDFFCESGCGFW